MNDKIQFTCPQCSHQMQLPSSTVGKQGKCPGCGQVVTITALVAETPADVVLHVATDPLSVAPQETGTDALGLGATNSVMDGYSHETGPLAPVLLNGVASSLGPSEAVPKKRRVKLLIFTHLLVAVASVALTMFLGPRFFSDDEVVTGNEKKNLSVNVTESNKEKSTREAESSVVVNDRETESISGFADIDDLGKAVLAAIASRDPDKVMNLYITPEVEDRFKECLTEASENPLMKELINMIRPGYLLRPNAIPALENRPTDERNSFQARYQRVREECLVF